MKEVCYHCGLDIENDRIEFSQKLFCCQGCKAVYEILNLHQMSDFYELNKKAGVRPSVDGDSKFDYLDEEAIFNHIVDFSEGDTSLVNFKIPVMHCTSCIWLLESVNKLHPSIRYSFVNFTKKTVQICFNHRELKLSELCVFLTNLGYKPVINHELSVEKVEKIDKTLLIKLAIAFFAFGNAMLNALPEYLGGKDYTLVAFSPLFRILSYFLSLPVVFYSASDYFKSAWFGLKNKRIVIDVPIVIGILVLFGRSVYEIMTDYGPGYFDTLCGLIFFMLMGKMFQQKTYNALSYDRDYKSFYPIAVTRLDFGVKKDILISELKIGDRILVRNQEIIPIDCVLIKGEGNIDNSFITGESATIGKKPGDKIFAGGKQMGASIEVEVIKDLNQSYLTQLWNKEAFLLKENGLDTLTNNISKYFTITILFISLFAGIYWYQINFEKMFQVVSAILIVACPCALALSAPFTMGHILRILGKNQMYVKDALTVEKMAKIDTLVFDKTGTITEQKRSKIKYIGKEISPFDEKCIKTLLNNSNHPLSRSLYDYLSCEDENLPLSKFEEVSGKGYSAEMRGKCYYIGSASYVNATKNNLETSVYIKINDEVLGRYVFENVYREGMKEVFDKLHNYEIHILSGDTPAEENRLKEMFPNIKFLKFNQSPEDKLNYIHELQNMGKHVAMLGDGLNDAGALKQSNVGIAIADDQNSFTPASDVIMYGKRITEFDKYLQVSKKAIQVVKMTFAISLMYNMIGLTIAVLGYMDPLVAAILMPISSISVVIFTTLSTWWRTRNYFKE